MQKFVQNLNDFEIIKEIGKGNFGKVFLVKNRKTNEKFATKVLQECQDFEVFNSFLNEVRISIERSFLSIIRIQGFNIHNFEGEEKSPTLFMEYARCGTLANTMKNSPKGWNSTKKLINIYGIVIGMKYLHEHNIIHQNLKPDNILLDINYYPKITDFGVSKIFPKKMTQKKLKSFIGTPLYMAPEIIKKKSYGFKADTYSFSLILYELFSNKQLLTNQQLLKAFTFSSIFELIKKIVKGKRPPLECIKYEDQKELLEKCWSDNPDKRFSFDDIYKFLQNHPNILHTPINGEELQRYLLDINCHQPNETNMSHELYSKGYKFYLEKQYSKCIEYYLKSIQLKNSNAMYSYAIMLREGKVIKRNYSEAIKYLKMSIELGNSKAMNAYGTMLEKGEGIELDYSEAIKYYKKSIELGNSNAMNNYANMLCNGKGIERNYSEAIKYLKKSIALGNSFAMNYYGNMLCDGKGVERNYSEAIKYFKMAIDLGNSYAMFNYAHMLSNGEGIQRNYSEAIMYYKMAIDLGNSFAMNDYANMFYSGEGFKRNYSEAIRYYKMAIDLGNSEAMNNYAYMLKNGEGTERNYSEAVKYYKMAIELDDSDAMCTYACMLKNGEGIECNYSKAIKYYKKSIKLGNINAMNEYAAMLKSLKDY